MTDKLENKNFKIEDRKWQLFKKMARKKGSNASVELRKFIQNYIKENNDNFQYNIKTEEDCLQVKELQETVYNIDKSVYNWFKNYNEKFKKMLDPDNLFELINLENLQKVSSDYWTDIARAVMILIGFGCQDVYVFGSVAKNQQEFNSDLDLAVTDCPDGLYYKILGKLINVLEHDVDLVVLDNNKKFSSHLKNGEAGELIRVTKR